LKTTNTGFTLAEVAIVLVIVGLVLGGVLKAQELVVQSKIKHVIADITGVSAAMYAYHDRYRALPGDDKGSGRWALTPPSSAGNGVIEGTYASTAPTDESRLVWEHLRRAGFVAGDGSENPFNVLFGPIGVQTGDGSGASPGGVLGTAANTELFTGLMLCTAKLPDKVALSVDAQMDDGKGKTGSVRANRATYHQNNGKGKGKGGDGDNPTAVKEVADDYTEDGVTTYVVCRQILL
jgi:prepilin-type N-terminal cleavage/methylation domain-containing protein